jgi:multiple sugar transport system permease protein
VTANSGRVRTRHGLIHAILIVTGAMMAFPFVWQLIMAFSTNQEIVQVPPTFWPAELQWQNFVAAFERLPLFQQFGNSIVVTLLRVVGQVVFCCLAGYAFARMQFPFRRLLFGIVLSILMIPSQVYLIPQYQLMRDLGLLETVLAIALPGMFSAFGTFLMCQAFIDLPRELEEAARIDGANPARTFFTIMLPLVRPSIAALVITCVLWSWNDLLWPLVVTTRAENMPISVGLATLQGQNSPDYAVIMATATLATAPILILFLLMQRRVIEGLAFSGVRG